MTESQDMMAGSPMATSQHYSASTSSVSSSMSSTLDDREVSGGIGIQHDEDQEEGQQLLEVHSNMHPPTPSGIQTRAAAWSPPAPVLGDQKLNKAMPPIPKQDLENEVLMSINQRFHTTTFTLIRLI